MDEAVDYFTPAGSAHEDHGPRHLGRCHGLVRNDHDCPNRAAHDLAGYGGVSPLLLCCECFRHVSDYVRGRAAATT